MGEEDRGGAGQEDHDHRIEQRRDRVAREALAPLLNPQDEKVEEGAARADERGDGNDVWKLVVTEAHECERRV